MPCMLYIPCTQAYKYALLQQVVRKEKEYTLDCANFELTNHIAYRVENKSLISTPRKLISTAGKFIFQVREYT